jgi:hypothetical protein
MKRSRWDKWWNDFDVWTKSCKALPLVKWLWGWELRSESLHEIFLNSHAPVKRELISKSLHEIFFNSHAPVKREQESHESWWELRSESLHEIFLNSHVPAKREQELHGSWLASNPLSGNAPRCFPLYYFTLSNVRWFNSSGGECRHSMG